MYLLYTSVLYVGLVLTLPYWLLRFRRYLPSLTDRLGLSKLYPLRRAIWIHAVSVGEVKSVEKLIEKLSTAFPEHAIVVSTVTPTGQELARARRDIIDQTFYFPIDIPGAVKRTLDRINPELVVMAETRKRKSGQTSCVNAAAGKSP
jgi:3-deoxy-D-manno-octulosonic-acid transferase